MTALVSGGSLIQGTFPGTKTTDGNLEAVLGRALGQGLIEVRHWWRDQSVIDSPWQSGGIITSAAIGAAWLTQRADAGDRHGNFEVVVPERRGREIGLAHYWLDNSRSGARAWNPVDGWIASGVTEPAAVIENRVNHNLEAVALEGRRLVHHWFDGTAWREAGTITDRADGPASLFQSSFENQLVVIVPESGELVLYWLTGFGPDYAWFRDEPVITNAGDGLHGAVQGHYGAEPYRNFELLVPRGDTLAAYWRDNSRESPPWRPARVATWGAGTVIAASLCSTTRGSGWLQALTQEDTSIYHLYRHDLPDGYRWMRGACLRLDDPSPADQLNAPRSRWLAQITGERDDQHGGPSLSSLSGTRSGIRGTDLGVSFMHQGRHLLLFGDTHWDDPDWATLDAIAEVHPPASDVPGALPAVELHGSPLEIDGGSVTQTEYDVPLDAFSLLSQLFVFFSADHFTDGKVMGRSVLTRALDPSLPIGGQHSGKLLHFQPLTTFSAYRFINVSTQVVPAAAVPGFGQAGPLLLVWGSGAYRADDLRLAMVDLRDPALWTYLLDDRPFDSSLLGVRYLTGWCGDSPLWSLREDDARPLLWPAALGELSVRWVPELNRYAYLSMSGPGDHMGSPVLLRVAHRPWGPWSKRRVVFDWVADGLGFRPHSTRFIHRQGEDDGVGDCIFEPQCGTGGGAYAPYLFDARRRADVITLRYTLSTWNPYQSMLMSHDITLTELLDLGP